MLTKLEIEAGRRKLREERLKRRDTRPWRERVATYNRIKQQYVNRGIPVEQFLTDHPDIVEKNNITKEDLAYVISLIEERRNAQD